MEALAAIALYGGAAVVKKVLEARRVRSAERARIEPYRAVPVVAIAAAEESTLTAVVGRVAGALPLIAPLTGRRCVYWQIQVENTFANRNDDRARSVLDCSPTRTFTIADDSGEAVVDPAWAEIAVAPEVGQQIVPVDARHPAAQSWLERHGLATKGRFFRRNQTLIESALTADVPIAVVGTGVKDGGHGGAAERGYRDAAPPVLHIGGTADHPIYITDAPSFTRRGPGR